MSTVGTVILAAGASTRMGTPKQLLPYQGSNLLAHTVKAALTSVCRPIIVVLGAHAQQIMQEISQFPVQVIENRQWSEGMGSSIRTGMNTLNAVPESIDAVVLMLCDQPFISCKIINKIVDVYYSTNKPIVAAEYSGTFGVPALFSHTFFSELATLECMEGAKQVIAKHSRDVFCVPFSQGAIDIDTPQDYEQLMAACGKRLLRLKIDQ